MGDNPKVQSFEVRALNADLDNRDLDAVVKAAEQGDVSAVRKLAGKQRHLKSN